MGADSKLFINWSEPTKVQTKYGPKWMRYWIIPKDYLEGFFVFWNNSKVKLKAQCYSISKNKLGQWTLNEWQTYKADFRSDFGRDNPTEQLIIQKESTLAQYNVKNVKGLREFQIPSVAKLCAAILKNKAALDAPNLLYIHGTK